MAKKIKKTADKDKESASSEVARKFKSSPFLYAGSIVILVLVTIAFLAGDFLRGIGGEDYDLTFGYYDKAPITWVPENTFYQNQQMTLNYYQSQGVDVNNYWALSQIWRQAFDATVVHTAVLQILKRSNYAVPEKTVDRQVAQLPHFQENGRFSASLYQQMPDSRRLALWRQVYDELARNMFYTDYFYGLLMPSGEAKFISNMASVVRSFDMVSFKVDDYPNAEYLSYARQHSDLFRTIHLSIITINSNEREAKKINDSVKNGSITFEDAARAQSQDSYSDRGGDMGSRFVFELETEIPNSGDRETIFNLRRGEISDVIRIGENWAFFRIEEDLKPANFEDALTMDKVRAHIRNFDRGRMEDWAIAQAMDFIAEAEISGFDNAARWLSMEKYSFGPLPVNYGSIDLFTTLESFSISGFSSQDIQSLSRNENFWKIAFSTKVNTPSQPLVQGNNVIVVLPVEQINVDESELEIISSIYSSYWLNYMTEQSFMPYFLNNERMDDRFFDTFFRNFTP